MDYYDIMANSTPPSSILSLISQEIHESWSFQL